MQLFNAEEIKETVRNGIAERGISYDVLNDKGLSRMFAEVFKPVLRYNPQTKHWFYYDGKVWNEDLEGLAVQFFAKLFSDELNLYCENITLDKSAKTKIKELSSMGKRNTIINDAKCECPVNIEDFDKYSYLLNCKNGTYNLRTFEFMPHSADDMLSKICNVSYDPNARCERWEQFIDEVMEGDKEKADFLQRILGYSITGDVREEKFYILYGASSRNGKSTLLETISYLLGGSKGYSVNVATSTFSGKRERSATAPNADIARLVGARLAVTSELNKNMLLDTGMIKAMTGRDKITARHLYGKEFEFTPQFKLFMNTNNLPTITDDSIFASKRVVVIEFNRHFTEQEQDKALKYKFTTPENLSGILNWLLNGCHKIIKGKNIGDTDGQEKYGMPLPQSVLEATARFREECDKISCFIEQCLDNSGGNTKFKDIYEAYRQWTLLNGYACEGKGRFKNLLNEKRMLSKTGTVVGKTEYNVIKGYTIKKDYQQTNNISSEATPKALSTPVQELTPKAI